MPADLSLISQAGSQLARTHRLRSARVFISCGQLKEHEKRAGTEIVAHFESRGFETYFADRVHSAQGLTESIFEALRESEYFVFVNFRRERLGWKKRWRGSLFVNQEIAIATFLEIPTIGFVETGVVREGVADYHIHNAVEFSDAAEIAENLAELSADWDPQSVNELAIRYDPQATTRGIQLDSDGSPKSDWYHLEISNRSKHTHAFECAAYVTEILDLAAKSPIPIPTVELNWAAIGEATTNIMSGTTRDLDAVFVVHGEAQVRFHPRKLMTTNPRYRLDPLPPGRYAVEFTVISANFAPVAKRLFLEFGSSPESVVFRDLTGDDIADVKGDTALERSCNQECDQEGAPGFGVAAVARSLPGETHAVGLRGLSDFETAKKGRAE